MPTAAIAGAEAPPLYVVARRREIVDNFLAMDLAVNPRRGRHVYHANHLKGASPGQLLIIHPTAQDLPGRAYEEIMEMARQLGFVLVSINDYYARQRYSRTRGR